MWNRTFLFIDPTVIEMTDGSRRAPAAGFKDQPWRPLKSRLCLKGHFTHFVSMRILFWEGGLLIPSKAFTPIGVKDSSRVSSEATPPDGS